MTFGTAFFKRIDLKHHVFVKTTDFFQNTTSSRPLFKVVCYFIFHFSKISSQSMAIIHSFKRPVPFLLVSQLSLALIHCYCCHWLCHSQSLFVIRCTTRCHSFSFVVIRCHSLYHSLSRVVPFIITRCHSLSLVVPLVVTRCTTSLSFHKRSLLEVFCRTFSFFLNGYSI